MPRVRDLLYRFRPAGAPGPASAAAVPADRVADRTAELEPVFALLAETQAQCAEIRDEGDRDAAARREQAQQTARRLVAEASSQAAEDRAAAAAAFEGRAAEEVTAMGVAARLEADGLLERADARVPEWADRVAARVAELLARTSAGARS